MRVRPIYETAENRAAECEVAKILANEWGGLKFEKLHHTYRLDFAVYGDDGSLVTFVEVKDRSGRFHWDYFAQRGVYQIALHKWVSAVQLCGASERPFYLAIKCKDGVYIARLRPDKMELPRTVHGGRTDRKIRCPDTGALIPDPADQEPMIEIPTSLFEKVQA